jgi:hypothetical protein
MRKILISIIVLGLIFPFTSCEDDYEPGGTAVEEMSGKWTVVYDHSSYGADPFGVGKSQIYTYNTADNSTTEMWLFDDANFWYYKVKVPINLENKTFGTSDTLVNNIDGYEIKVIVRNGKIIENGAVPPSGLPVDSIYFELWFEDLVDYTGIPNDTLLVSGYRYTGWPEDL